MDRDEAGLLLAILVCGALLWVVGAFAPASTTTDERAAWRRLWGPAIPASIPFFVLLGWAVVDWEGPQQLGVTRLLAVIPGTVVWIRAAWRATRSLFPKHDSPAAVTGFLRPRMNLSVGLCGFLQAAELRAVIAHEQAHIRHRDPLRIWLAQVITDLQWPVPVARRRQRGWMRALELARDEEARRMDGVEPEDLASALIKAVRLSHGQTAASARASLTDDETFLAERVRRLLGPLPTERHAQGRSILLPLTFCLAGASFVFGMLWAQPIVAILAGSR